MALHRHSTQVYSEKVDAVGSRMMTVIRLLRNESLWLIKQDWHDIIVSSSSGFIVKAHTKDIFFGFGKKRVVWLEQGK